jgi:2-methylcitrate synthase
MSSSPAVGPKPKKSVALSGVPAGNTALCTVGRSGNDLHYRGYDILDFADQAQFEEVAYLLVHDTLPTRGELAKYKEKLKSLRGLPAPLKTVLEQLPKSAHPMDVLRTGCSVLGTLEPEQEGHPIEGARNVADRLMACFGSMLLYWYHYANGGKRIETQTDDDSIGGHYLHLLHGKKPSPSWVRAMHTSLILYAEHEFNASTFACRVVAGTGSDIYSAITGGIGALRGPKHGGANEVADLIQKRYKNAEEAQADIRRRMAAKEIVIGFGHPVYTTGDPRNKVIKAVAERLSKESSDLTQYRVAERIEKVMWDEKKMFANLDSAGRRTSSSSASTARSSARRPTTPGRKIASGCRSSSDKPNVRVRSDEVHSRLPRPTSRGGRVAAQGARHLVGQEAR